VTLKQVASEQPTLKDMPRKVVLYNLS